MRNTVLFVVLFVATTTTGYPHSLEDEDRFDQTNSSINAIVRQVENEEEARIFNYLARDWGRAVGPVVFTIAMIVVFIYVVWRVCLYAIGRRQRGRQESPLLLSPANDASAFSSAANITENRKSMNY